MNRSAHWMRTACYGIKLIWPNWYVVYNTGEQGNGGSASLTAAIEYPVGTFTRVTFSGASTAAVADGENFVSDLISISIPAGAKFFVRTYFVGAAGIVYVGKNAATSFGEAFAFGASGIADQTMGGTITDGAAGLYQPCAIVGYSAKTAVGVFGDSRAFGQLDPYIGATTDIGQAGRALGGLIPALQYGMPSSSAFQETGAGAGSTTRFAKRRALISAYCNAVLVQLGINDVQLQSRTAAQALGDLQTVWRAFQADGLPVIQTTINPTTTSTDGWVTTANQTVMSGNTNRIALNNAIRQSPDVQGVVDVADALESARDSGLWKAYNPALTSDGVHENYLGNSLIASSGVLTPGRFP